MRLALFLHEDGVAAQAPNTILYDLAAGTAHGAPASVAGGALRWALVEDEAEAEAALLAHDVALDPGTGWVMRCDRVAFQPGGMAYRHTHPGPGIRYLLHGAITIDSAGAVERYGPGEPWFESGPEPVLATTAQDEPSAFARVLLLPERFAGQRTIRYVDPADAERPKLQQATILLERPVAT